MNELEIVELLLQKDEKGMSELLIHYGPLMRYIIAPILPNAQDREDCLSECAMQVWKKIEKFDPQRGGWSAWLTAVRRALDRLSYKDRTLFYRKYYYMQPSAQIASEMGMTERAVEGKLYRIKIKLRKTLGGEGYE